MVVLFLIEYGMMTVLYNRICERIERICYGFDFFSIN